MSAGLDQTDAPVRVTNDEGLDWSPAWSADGGHLYFSSQRGGSTNLWRIPIDESSGKLLGPAEAVTTPSTYSGYASVSSTGQRVAYIKQDRTSNIYKIGFDPAKEAVVGPPVPVTQGSREFWMAQLSPDEDWLAMAGRAKNDLFLIRPDGSSLSQLTRGGRLARRWPRWMPDGRRVLFCEEGKLFLVDSVSKKAHEILSVSPREVYEYQPAVTRSQRLLYFTVVAPEVDVWLMILK